MTAPTPPGPDPRTDPDVRWRAQHAANRVLAAARDVLYRRADADGWFYLPEPLDAGDVTGLMAAADRQVLDVLAAAVAAARAEYAAIRADIDHHQRQVHGDHWRPPGRAA